MGFNSFSRADRSVMGAWWWTIDRWLFIGLMVLLVIGALLSMAASPPVAELLKLNSFYFVKRHLLMCIPAVALMVGVSFLPPKFVRYIAWVALGFCIICLVITPFQGMEIKGAHRWINIFGFSLQASEFVKPLFAIIAAWLFSRPTQTGWLSGRMLSMGLYGVLIGLILLQPDLGMAFIISLVWFVQFFLAGLRLFWVMVLAAAGIIGLVVAYFLFPHVTSRIDRFLSSDAGDQYQITQSLQGFKSGGLLGRGPGEGIVKKHLPDAHADFVFSVAGEEFGLFFCLFIVALFVFLMWRGLRHARYEQNYFLMLAITGLMVQFSSQALVNMASSLHLMPTKGMTLPFLSYGGSSLLAMAFGMGALLSFTRRRLDDKGVN